MSPFTSPLPADELPYLLQRLARLVQEMGDRGLEPDTYPPVPTLRPRYLQLVRQATYVAQTMGFAEAESVAYITGQLVEHLRKSNRRERRAMMSLQEALSE